MARHDLIPVWTLEELIAAQEQYRRGVADGSLIPLMAHSTQTFFAYAESFDPSQGPAMVLNEKLLDELFVAEQRAFNSRLN